MAQELIQDGKLNRQAAADALRDFLENIVRAAGFQLKVTVSVAAPEGGSDAEVLADVDGRDKEILLERGADVLKALEHLAFRALRLEPEHHEKIHIDCGGGRARRPLGTCPTAQRGAGRVRDTPPTRPRYTACSRATPA